MKTLTLDVEYDCDFTLFGLVSSSREYRLAWQLNHTLRLRLIKQKDLVYEFFSQGRLVISNYLYTTETCTLRLLRNRSLETAAVKKPFLAPDIKEYDYLIQVCNGTGALDSPELLNRLTALPDVQYACEFDPNGLQFKENLLF